MTNEFLDHGSGAPNKTDLVVVAANDLIWRGERYSCTIGAGGVRQNKQEGDGATPAGCFALRRVLFRPDRLDTPGIQQMLKEMLTEIVGQPVVLAIRLGGEEASAPAEEPPAAGAQESGGKAGSGAAPGDAVRRLAERFDGQIMEADDPPR